MSNIDERSKQLALDMCIARLEISIDKAKAVIPTAPNDITKKVAEAYLLGIISAQDMIKDLKKRDWE